MIFMTHPEHGATHVTPFEAETLKAFGWRESTHAEWLAKKLSPEPASESEPIRRKPGRPRKAQ